MQASYRTLYPCRRLRLGVRRSLGGIGGALGGLGGGNVGTQKGKAQVQLTARIVSADTAEILASEKGDGRSERSGLLLGGGGGATEAAVEAPSGKLIGKADRVPERVVEVRGLVADVDGSTMILNVGSSARVAVGDTLNVLRVTRTVKDPATGEVLREITEEVATARIDEVDAVSSVATVVEGSGVQVGDGVRK